MILLPRIYLLSLLYIVLINIVMYLYLILMYTIACNKAQFVHCTTAIKRGGSGAATTRNFFCFRVRVIGGSAKRNGVCPSEAGSRCYYRRRRNLRRRPCPGDGQFVTRCPVARKIFHTYFFHPFLLRVMLYGACVHTYNLI